MKKVALVLGASSVLLSCCLSFGPKAFAKETEGEVSYISGALTLDPEVESEDPNEPGKINHSLPTNLNFGAHEIQTKTNETWVATTDGDQASTPTVGTVRVHDNRGEQPGWSVKVKQVAQFTSVTTSTPLNGAELRINGGADVTNNINVSGITNSPNIIFDAFNEDKSVLSAIVGNGAGETEFDLTRFELFVAKNNEKVKEKYETALVWTVSEAP